MSGFSRRGVFHLLLGAVVAACSATAFASPIFYGVTGSNLLRFDMGAQTVSVIATMQVGGSNMTVMEDCDFDSAFQLWGMRQGNIGGFPPQSVSRAYRIDVATGNATPFGDYGLNATQQSLAFRASDGQALSVNSSGGTTTGHLVITDLLAGTVADVGPHNLSPVRVDALAFAPDGTLFGVWNANSSPFGSNDYKLVRFNTGNGAGTIIGSIGALGSSFASLRFDSAGVAYTVETNTGDVYTVSTATGQGTFLFAGGVTARDTRGLAFTPEPESAMLFGLIALLLRRRS